MQMPSFWVRGRAIGFYSFCVVLLAFTSCASIYRPAPGMKKLYQEIVDFPNRPKSEISEGALRGMAKIFNSSKAVIQYQNTDEGQIIGKGEVGVVYTIAPVSTYFTLTIEVKDEKLRATFSRIYGNESNPIPLYTEDQIDKFIEVAKHIVADLKATVIESWESW